MRHSWVPAASNPASAPAAASAEQQRQLSSVGLPPGGGSNFALTKDSPDINMSYHGPYVAKLLILFFPPGAGYAKLARPPSTAQNNRNSSGPLGPITPGRPIDGTCTGVASLDRAPWARRNTGIASRTGIG